MKKRTGWRNLRSEGLLRGGVKTNHHRACNCAKKSMRHERWGTCFGGGEALEKGGRNESRGKEGLEKTRLKELKTGES